MEQPTVKTIDELGRVILPGKLMQKLGWGQGDELTFSNTSRAIVLSLSRRHEGPRCVICKKLEQEVKLRVNGSDICSGCMQIIVDAGSCA